MLDRHYVWESLQGTGLEHVHAGIQPDGSLQAVGVMLHADGPVSLRYRVGTHSGCRVVEADIALDTPSSLELTLRRDGHGRWSVNGVPHAQFDDCQDVDIAGCGLTNVLPIRRLKLKIGDRAELPMLYVPLPSLDPCRTLQRYTRLPDSEDGFHRYRYEGLQSGFTADLTVDDAGFTTDYPGVLRSLYPNQTMSPDRR